MMNYKLGYSIVNHPFLRYLHDYGNLHICGKRSKALAVSTQAQAPQAPGRSRTVDIGGDRTGKRSWQTRDFRMEMDMEMERSVTKPNATERKATQANLPQRSVT